VNASVQKGGKDTIAQSGLAHATPDVMAVMDHQINTVASALQIQLKSIMDVSVTNRGLERTVASSRDSVTLDVMAAMDHQIANVSSASSMHIATPIRRACVSLCGTMSFTVICHMLHVHFHVKTAT